MREEGSGTREILEIFFESIGVKLDKAIELSDAEAVINYVKVDMGVSCISYIVARQKEKVGKINISRYENYKIQRSLYMVIHKDKYISPAIRKFINFCENFNCYN